jgi:lipid A 3-O-deacylase
MHRFIPVVVCLFLFCASQSAAQETPPANLFYGPHRDILTFNIENDLYGRGSDRGYTNGVRFGLLKVNPEIPDFIRNFASVVPTIKINKTTSLVYSVGQNLFTPDDITQSTPAPNERPWAAFLYGSAGLATQTNNRKDEIEATIGVIGPAALGRPVQTFIHENITNSPTPRGWDNQLKNEPILMLAWQRSWLEFANGNTGPLYWGVSPHIGVTLGNAYTFAHTGFTVRLSPSDNRWQDAPVRVRPALPGTGFFEVPENDWGWYLFAGMDARAVARNIFLDGNTFTDSASVDKKPFVTDLNAGLALTYKRTRISYTVNYRTLEYDGQSEPDLFGAVSVGWRF